MWKMVGGVSDELAARTACVEGCQVFVSFENEVDE
jgi:hypothetical protein